ncbi:DUF3352 domain-containing protein [Coraliomargarita sp. SDUM461004]|uniref:DUF3352 domain-containing protein n=1 Tax=Thalassobacterium sedimentorum TaxID=3041258 RepID=A0ABU1AF64_9BACT|nr:DUF3352 domain-containing protein [Coraliomargarita sp. SDUM461004]MDQ8193457.1 DUF3352 domain-containing protein [Coraliomargarita sp. SDUM461004]
MGIQQIWTAYCLVATAVTLSATPLNQLTEADADLYIAVRSLADMHAGWDTHPFVQAAEDSDLQEVLNLIMQLRQEAGETEEESFRDVLELEFGLTVDALFELFPGQVSLACYNAPELMLKQAERPELIFMAEYSGDFEQLEQLMQVQFERNAESQQKINPLIEHTMIEESFMGETLYFDEAFDGENSYIEDGYALVDGIFVLATPEHRLRAAVEAIKLEPDAALGDRDAYIRSREEAGRGDLELYVNLETILPPLNEALIDKAMQGGAMMLGLSPDSLNQMLSLESLRACFLNGDLVDSGLELYSGLLYREKNGLLSLMTYAEQPLPAARYVPDGVLSTAITNLDLGELLTQLENLLMTASPMLRGQIDSQLQVLRTNTGIDFRSAVLENFGGEMVSLSLLAESAREAGGLLEPDQVFVLELEDSEALSGALEGLKDLVPGLRQQILTQEFAGQRIHSFQTAAPAGASNGTISYVITRSELILSVGRVGLLQEVLSRLESSEDGFWQLADTQAMFEHLAQPNAVARSYIELEKFLLPMLQSLLQASQGAQGDASLNTTQLPRDLSLPFYLISETNQAEDGLFNRSFIRAREDSK